MEQPSLSDISNISELQARDPDYRNRLISALTPVSLLTPILANFDL